MFRSPFHILNFPEVHILARCLVLNERIYPNILEQGRSAYNLAAGQGSQAAHSLKISPVASNGL